MKDLVAICQCSRLDHAVRFEHDADDRIVYVSLVLRHDMSLWRRVRAAWRYLVGGAVGTCAYGGCSEVLIEAKEFFEWARGAEKTERGDLR